MKYKMQHIVFLIMTLYCFIEGVISCGKAAPPNFGVPVYKPVKGRYEYENKYKILNREQRDLSMYSQNDLKQEGKADSRPADPAVVVELNDFTNNVETVLDGEVQEEGQGRAMLDLIIEAALNGERSREEARVKNLIVTRKRRDIHVSEQKNDKAQETVER